MSGTWIQRTGHIEVLKKNGALAPLVEMNHNIEAVTLMLEAVSVGVLLASFRTHPALNLPETNHDK